MNQCYLQFHHHRIKEGQNTLSLFRLHKQIKFNRKVRNKVKCATKNQPNSMKKLNETS